MHADIQADIQAWKYINRQTHTQTDKYTQADTYTDTKTDRNRLTDTDQLTQTPDADMKTQLYRQCHIYNTQ